ncbi:MAG: ABC transporter substrate-binding protein [Rhizobiales bacterium]|nr:ABC transporter substrate-binding protein [Hyphomicrobiales bacterium]MBI3674520.1 ABC transporter substrate-binding protein [Hyphomicrobiales bacterium]
MKLKQAQKAVSLGKLSRRDFMQFAVASGVTIAAANTLFATAARAAPKKGGTFKIGVGHGATTDTLDPSTWTNGLQFDMSVGIFGAQLTQIDQKTAIVPHLAESIEPSDGASKWVFKLRKGLTFHNGKTVTAQDVVETYNYHRGEKSKSAVKSVLAIVKDIKADGPETVVFTLNSGSADFPYVTSDYHLPIYPAKDGGGIEWEKGISAGPYILENYEPGIRVTAKRNPNYLKPDSAWFDSVEILSIVDTAARTNALLSGEVHYINRADLKTIDMLKQNPEIEIVNVTGFGHYVAPMNVTQKPFDDVHVRLALKWAIDRKELVDKILLGYGTPGNDNPIAPSIKFATNPQPVYSYDPEKAKFHLKKAGMEGLKVDFSTSNAAFSGAVDAALLMQAQAKAAGIDINVIREPDDSYWDNVWMKKPWSMSYWGGRPTVDWMMTTAYAADAAWNDTSWKNPRFNELLVAARSETDETKRAAMYAEMQQILHDDGGVIVLMFNNFVSANSKRVAHGDLNSNFDDDGGYIFERWWMA